MSMPFGQARGLISEGRGRHFDPDVVDAFVDDFAKFRAIAELYSDADPDPLDAPSAAPAHGAA